MMGLMRRPQPVHDSEKIDRDRAVSKEAQAVVRRKVDRFDRLLVEYLRVDEIRKSTLRRKVR